MRNPTANIPRLLTILLTGVIAVLGLTPSGAQGAGLPDGRVYELVSPADKSGSGGGVLPLGTLVESEQLGQPLQSSASGDGIVYEAEDFFEPRLGSGFNEYFSQRDDGNWVTSNMTPGVPAHAVSTEGENRGVGWAPDLSVQILGSADALTQNAPTGYQNLYAVRGGSMQPLLTVTPPNRSTETFGYASGGESSARVSPEMLFAGGNEGAGAVSPYSHLLFAANDALTPATSVAPAAMDGGEFQDNLYEWTEDGLRLVNVLPNGHTEPDASFGVEYGDRSSALPRPSLSHVISADGTLIFWTDELTGDLYVREDGERTTLIAKGGEFAIASTDGGRVIYTKEENLYQYDTATHTTTDIAAGGVQGVVAGSADASLTYFVSTAVLTAGAKVGAPNLYLSRESSPSFHTLTFVATLSPADNEIHGNAGGGSGAVEGDWYRTFAGRTAETSPSGRYLAFMSIKSLTGYDNTLVGNARTCVENVPSCASEVFLYDADTGSLACASCNTNGTTPSYDTSLPAAVNGIYQPRYVTDSGRFFFSTRDPVIPQDVNGKSDVYEYENGYVSLISPGDQPAEAVFADAGENGNDLFFTTAQQLVLADHDQSVDIYDARVGGSAEQAVSSPCVGEGCREPLSAPVAQIPVSASYGGPGNAVASSTPSLPRARVLSRAKQFARAMRACRAERSARRRATCIRRASRLYSSKAARRNTDSRRAR